MTDYPDKYGRVGFIRRAVQRGRPARTVWRTAGNLSVQGSLAVLLEGLHNLCYRLLTTDPMIDQEIPHAI
jgi:hypothetical protein